MTTPLLAHEASGYDEETLIVLVGDQLLVYPGSDCYGPQCVAENGRRRQRCSGSAQESYQGYDEIFVPGADALVSALVPCGPDEGFFEQRCSKHLGSDAPNAVDPEWELFDPQRHASLLTPAAPRWTPEGVRPDPRTHRLAHLFRSPDPTPNPEPTPEPEPVWKPLIPNVPLQHVEPVPTALYRYWDADDVLLYVGITGNLRHREKSHLKRSSWMDFMARSEVERFPSREDAEAAEVAAIISERPLFNSKHNEGPEAVSRVVEYLIAHGRTDLLAPAVSRG